MATDLKRVLKRAVADVAFTPFKAGTTINGVDEYDVDHTKDGVMVLRVVTSLSPTPVEFTITVNEGKTLKYNVR